jgi:hypothetical protein
MCLVNPTNAGKKTSSAKLTRKTFIRRAFNLSPLLHFFLFCLFSFGHTLQVVHLRAEYQGH